jgi:hypothetical protein
MGLGARLKLTVVVLCAFTASACLLAGPAVGKQQPAKKSYTPSGNGTYASTGQACFAAKWAGTGSWKTSYKETDAVNNVVTSTDTVDGGSSYSWDEYEVVGAAACALELLKQPGSKPAGGATWNKGYTRIGSAGTELKAFPYAPSTTTPCSESATKRPGAGGFSGGDLIVEPRGASVVFQVNLGFPSEDCDYGFPGDQVPEGSVGGDFLESTSVKVPDTVFQHARKVVISISSDGKSGATPNCGVPTASSGGQTVTCSQSGNWQGKLTLYEG